jgi:hypothetical protein
MAGGARRGGPHAGTTRCGAREQPHSHITTPRSTLTYGILPYTTTCQQTFHHRHRHPSPTQPSPDLTRVRHPARTPVSHLPRRPEGRHRAGSAAGCSAPAAPAAAPDQAVRQLRRRHQRRRRRSRRGWRRPTGPGTAAINSQRLHQLHIAAAMLLNALGRTTRARSCCWGPSVLGITCRRNPQPQTPPRQCSGRSSSAPG